jgi:hypothetical protein
MFTPFNYSLVAIGNRPICDRPTSDIPQTTPG